MKGQVGLWGFIPAFPGKGVKVSDRGGGAETEEQGGVILGLVLRPSMS